MVLETCSKCDLVQGKIRVFARIRPIMEFEKAKGQTAVLNVPDELTVTHLWKGAPREYSFDTVFSPEATQEQVLLSRSTT